VVGWFRLGFAGRLETVGGCGLAVLTAALCASSGEWLGWSEINLLGNIVRVIGRTGFPNELIKVGSKALRLGASVAGDLFSTAGLDRDLWFDGRSWALSRRRWLRSARCRRCGSRRC
jgi:hypothetical protein